MSRFDDKRLILIKKLSDNLRAQRERVFQETPEQFAQRLAIFGPPVPPGMVERMEAGDPSAPLEHWLSAWMAMQVADSVVEGSRSDAALFLAATRPPAGIETEIAQELAKKGDG